MSALPGHVLSGSERRALSLLFDAFLPATTEEPLDYWSFSGGTESMVDAADSALSQFASPSDIRKLRMLLRLLSGSLAGWLGSGRAARLDRQTPEERERLLCRLRDSRNVQLRKAFLAFKGLAGFLFHTGADQEAVVGFRRAIGYRPPPASSNELFAGLNFVEPFETNDLSCDALVIGSGAGGGVTAALLAGAGLSVLIVEQGESLRALDIDRPESQALGDGYWSGGGLTTQDGGFNILAGATIGGGTAVNWASCFRLPKHVRQEWAELGLEDIADSSFDECMYAVESRLGAGGENVYPDSGRDGRLEAGCHALDWHVESIRRGVQGCGDCVNCGWCGFGCMGGHKQSSTVTYLADACANGAEILSGAWVCNLETYRGRVSGARVFVAGREVLIRTHRIFLSGGSIGSPGLLLRSGLDHPAVGRNLRLHPTVAVCGFYPEPVEPWLGPTQGVWSGQFGDEPGKPGFLMETAPTHPGLIASALNWKSGREYREDMLRSRYACALIGIVRDTGSGKVTLDRDGREKVSYRINHIDAATVRQATEMQSRIHAAAGAERIVSSHLPALEMSSITGFTNTHWKACQDEIARRPIAPTHFQLWSAHQLGTCRMGRDARTCAFTADGAYRGLHGLWVTDASAFPTASGVNPMETIIALSMRTVNRLLTSAI